MCNLIEHNVNKSFVQHANVMKHFNQYWPGCAEVSALRPMILMHCSQDITTESIIMFPRFCISRQDMAPK